MPRAIWNTVEQVAARYHVPPKTVLNWIYAGRLKSFKPGRHRLISETELERFEAAGADNYGHGAA
ncbi:MAG TPA: helix-turn-helix domain-containing protein [Polyangia bacterium]|jgi:excisionase family DNA binding protein